MSGSACIGLDLQQNECLQQLTGRDFAGLDQRVGLGVLLFAEPNDVFGSDLSFRSRDTISGGSGAIDSVKTRRINDGEHWLVLPTNRFSNC